LDAFFNKLHDFLLGLGACGGRVGRAHECVEKFVAKQWLFLTLESLFEEVFVKMALIVWAIWYSER
jgi:hypothetical protein